MSNRRKYSSTFKAEVVQELLKEEKTLSQLASEHGIHTSVLGKWKRAALKALPGAFEENQQDAIARMKAEYEKKQEELYAEIGRLTTQVNFLKKKSGLYSY